MIPFHNEERVGLVRTNISPKIYAEVEIFHMRTPEMIYILGLLLQVVGERIANASF